MGWLCIAVLSLLLLSLLFLSLSCFEHVCGNTSLITLPHLLTVHRVSDACGLDDMCPSSPCSCLTPSMPSDSQADGCPMHVAALLPLAPSICLPPPMNEDCDSPCGSPLMVVGGEGCAHSLPLSHKSARGPHESESCCGRCTPHASAVAHHHPRASHCPEWFLILLESID
jgi:hypothetical protein